MTEKLQPALQKAQDNANAAQADFDKRDAEIKAQEEAVEALQLGDLRNQREKAKNLLQNIMTTIERIDLYRQEKKRREETSKEPLPPRFGR